MINCVSLNKCLPHRKLFSQMLPSYRSFKSSYLYLMPHEMDIAYTWIIQCILSISSDTFIYHRHQINDRGKGEDEYDMVKLLIIDLIEDYSE